MQHILASFEKALIDLSEQSTEADLQLAELKNRGMGKFNYILDQDSGFHVRSNRFQPYVMEITEQFLMIQNAEAEEIAEQLPDLVKKIELLMKTIQHFKMSIGEAENKTSQDS